MTADRPRGRRRKARVPRPDRKRSLKGIPFGWIDARIRHRGWTEHFTPEMTATYAFLCLVANRDGVSFYRLERIAHELSLDEREAHRALERLRELDLVAFEPFHAHAVDGFHQVLSLPREDPPPVGGELAAYVPDLGLPE